APHSHVPEQMNSPSHRPPQNSGAQRPIVPDMRLPSIKHFENIQQSSPKQHQVYPQLSQTANMQMHPQPPPIYNTSKSQHNMSNSIRNSPIPNLEYSNNTFSHSDLPPQSPHLAQNSTMWTR